MLANYTQNLEKFDTYFNKSTSINIIHREPNHLLTDFCDNLAKLKINIRLTITIENITHEIDYSFRKYFGNSIPYNTSYYLWVKDIINLCELYASIIEKNTLCFFLTSKRVCQKYHIDKVSLRLVTAYSGPGSEWVTEKIDNINTNLDTDIKLKNLTTRILPPWYVAILKGGVNGVIHKTPNIALKDNSLLLRLDHPDFLYNK